MNQFESVGYVYQDSSEDQCFDHSNNIELTQLSELPYHDSSSSQADKNNIYDDSQSSSESPNDEQNKNKKSKKLCKINSDKFLLNDNYWNRIQKIIKQSQQKIVRKTALLIPDTDKEIYQNLQKRNKKYGYFLRTLQIDKKYNGILQKKIEKLKAQNQRKKKVLQKKKQERIMQQDESQMKKYILDKKLKEQIVIDKIQKHAYKLGIQRIRLEEKKVKKQVKKIEQSNILKTINLDVKQRHQIQQLRQQLESIKQANRVNKLEQKKVLKDMKTNINNDKKFLFTKAESLKQKKFII